MITISQKDLGKIGEDKAVEMLLDKGYEIIERNYKYGKGEIDIIAYDPETDYTAFIEVKTRSNINFGEPVFGVTKNKMRQLKKLVSAYLFEKEINELQCRFDVMSVLMMDEVKPEIVHYINAFTDI